MTSDELLRDLGRDLNLSQTEVRRIVASAPFRYKRYTLPKRSGGLREIHHPTPELKAIQSWIVRHILSDLPVHASVYSYRKGLGIRDHARVHIGARYFMRLDFEDFFPSIRYVDVCRLLQGGRDAADQQLDEQTIFLLGRLLCRAPKGSRLDVGTLALSIGAPSSPAISNAILFDLDSKLADASARVSVTYSRYADDLYFSTRCAHTLERLLPEIRREIAALESPRLTINEGKTSRSSRKHRVQVTGITITPTSELSVGRDRKRLVRAQVYRYLQGSLLSEQVESLRGMISFIASIEPEFVARLMEKYGREKVASLLERLA